MEEFSAIFTNCYLKYYSVFLDFHTCIYEEIIDTLIIVFFIFRVHDNLENLCLYLKEIPFMGAL